MKTLIEHFNEMNNLFESDLTQEEKTYIYRKLNKINADKFQKVLNGGNLVKNNVLNECKESIKQIVINDETYKFCIRLIKNTKEKEEQFYIINFYSPSFECVVLQIDTKNKKAHLTDIFKQQGCLMKKYYSFYDDEPKNSGEILTMIVIDICKKFNLSEITLLDESYINCKNNKNRDCRINLLISKMIIDGVSWYGKFGFEPVDLYDKNIYKHNQKIYKKVLTKHITKEQLIKKISDFDKEKNNNDINNILKKYDEMKEQKLSNFMLWLSYNYCYIYCQIYEYIYEKVGYKKYLGLTFTLHL